MGYKLVPHIGQLVARLLRLALWHLRGHTMGLNGVGGTTVRGGITTQYRGAMTTTQMIAAIPNSSAKCSNILYATSCLRACVCRKRLRFRMWRCS